MFIKFLPKKQFRTVKKKIIGLGATSLGGKEEVTFEWTPEGFEGTRHVKIRDRLSDREKPGDVGGRW